MHLARDQYLFLSRTGRVSPSISMAAPLTPAEEARRAMAVQAELARRQRPPRLRALRARMPGRRAAHRSTPATHGE
jgi:hypothetical protein